MSRSLTRCIAALPPFGAPRVAALGRPSQTTTRLLAKTTPQRQDETPPRIQSLRDFFGGSLATDTRTQNPPENSSQVAVTRAFGNFASIDTSPLSGDPAKTTKPDPVVQLEPHHLHVFSHRHNTHITFTGPERNPIMSLSCGNLGYRKSRRGTFDSAYSLTKYVLERLVYTGVKFERLELVLRGFGPGREAAIKVLLSPEGKAFREKIIRVTDSTRVKFGGTRSEKPRRL